MNASGLRLALVLGVCCLLGWPSPVIARFLQADPVGYKVQTNLYAYVRNDPVNASDPTGAYTIVYHGSEREKDALRAIVRQAA